MPKQLSFYQRTPDQIAPLSPGVEAEIAIGDLTLVVHRFLEARGIFGPVDRPMECIAVRVETFTDCMSTWRKLDKMRVFHKIERAKLRNSDDLARLLVGCGLRHVPFAGHQYEPDGGASERIRIKALHKTPEGSGA